ncbi:MAG: Quinolinate synthase A [Methanosaeta sp. PtaB.Bin039]|nr:MAG: Quinolinate synthase A [Methanosaeta sp. PtaB.Bin039]OPY45153.1 MAG: Quinolinate synthase A [Methanosaeta sp. PtaU1.Bin028]HOT07011.1 quinolinate synthase NadA [Methanotrichaceae archaeon]HQF16062.1 quinolinate synthase NadA [Methanotrichaceae archaeon]HQI90822.1 quinolinate synthase NadA [Methanotrichaceae archaeon]
MIEEEILRLKEERNALILAHNYQPPELLEIADHCGDSLELSRAAAATDCDVVLFCGVDFMAQTAAVLSPEKTVILPETDACCPMSQMIRPQDVRSLKKEHPGAAVVCYVNTSAQVKAESDICCTSANGVAVVNSLPEKEIVFIPDRNLAAYVASKTDKRIIAWPGFCHVHDRYRAQDVLAARTLHPEAEVLVHPECRPEVVDLADGVYSTSGMAKHARASAASEFIIGTEVGMIYRLVQDNPDKHFFPLKEGTVCLDMKKITLKKVLRSLETLQPRITVPEQVAIRAKKAIDRMLAI